MNLMMPSAVESAEGILQEEATPLYWLLSYTKNNIMNALAASIKGTPYLEQAGSVICGLSMQTTNDMPIVYPPSFKTLGILPFDLNAHFLDADLQSKHMGETRDIE
jgi:dipeptidase E